MRVEDFLELDVEVDEVLLDSFEDWKLDVHNMELFVGLHPLEVIKPLSRVGLLVDLTRWACKEEAPLLHVYLVVSEEDLRGKEEREQQLVDFEEGTTNVLVESVREVLVEDIDSPDDVISLL